MRNKRLMLQRQLLRSAGFPTRRIADFSSRQPLEGSMGVAMAGAMPVENRRYGRLESLRYMIPFRLTQQVSL